MVRIDIENKLKEIIFKRGYVLTYEEVEPSSFFNIPSVEAFNDSNGLYKQSLYSRKAGSPIDIFKIVFLSGFASLKFIIL